MASSSHSPKRNKSCSIKGTTRAGHLETWLSGENEKNESFRHEMSRKVINTPKLLSFNWLKEKKLKEARKALKNKNLWRFLEINGNTFLDLVKVFYTNLTDDGENMYLYVKGVDMEITHAMWIAITGLKLSIARINKGNTSTVEDFNKIQYYVSCLRNPHMKVKGFHFSALKLNERVTAFIVTWMITSRGSNHVVLIEEDLVLVYCIMNNIKVMSSRSICKNL